MAQATSSRGAAARSGGRRLQQLERVTEQLRTLARNGDRAPAGERRMTASAPPLVDAIRAWERDLAAARRRFSARSRDTRAKQG
jgi:hypothetical protein